MKIELYVSTAPSLFSKAIYFFSPFTILVTSTSNEVVREPKFGLEAICNHNGLRILSISTIYSTTY
jgi:hypothetical protein